MTREVAIEIIQKLIGRFKSDSRTYKALEMAIQALSQEPTNTWSIKDVADTFKKHGLIREQEPCEDCDYKEWLKGEVEPKIGHWILDETDNSITCDKCGCLIWANDISNGDAHYCPNCGAKMESEE